MRATVGLIGDPVKHSVSPAMQSAAFTYHGLAEKYVLWPTPLADLPQRIAALRSPGMRGANVTLPHKTSVLRLLDDVDATVKAVGAANTIVQAAPGHLYGLNTDIQGFLRALQSVEFDPHGCSALVLGAGGAARAVVYGLISAGVRSLVVANRTRERAEMLLADMAALHTEAQLLSITLDQAALAAAVAGADILVNATSVGLDGQAAPIALPSNIPHMLVVDLLYHETPLLRQAAQRGARTQDGLEMLVQQGALAFEAWTGLPAPVDVMRTVVQQELGRRV